MNLHRWVSVYRAKKKFLSTLATTVTSLINRTAATAVFRWPSSGLFNDPDWARRFALKGPLPALLTLGQEAPDKHLRRSLENSSFK